MEKETPVQKNHTKLCGRAGARMQVSWLLSPGHAYSGAYMGALPLLIMSPRH